MERKNGFSRQSQARKIGLARQNIPGLIPQIAGLEGSG